MVVNTKTHKQRSWVPENIFTDPQSIFYQWE